MKTVILGLLIPFIGTSAGAACVFFLKKDLKRSVERALTGLWRADRADRRPGGTGYAIPLILCSRSHALCGCGGIDPGNVGG